MPQFKTDAKNRDYDSIIIIGAGRSGTNMLRDILSRFPDYGTWPCDEINYIWRHGNARHQTDEFLSEFAVPHVCKFIQNCFKYVAHKYSCKVVIEKTEHFPEGIIIIKNAENGEEICQVENDYGNKVRNHENGIIRFFSNYDKKYRMALPLINDKIKKVKIIND